MALVRIDHVPETIKVNLPLNIILPDPGRMQGVPVRNRKALYLLHGLSDDASAWQRYSSIETVASAYGLVVVMPSVGRSFSIDQPNGQAYFTYLIAGLSLESLNADPEDPRREEFALLFGDLAKLKGSEHDPAVWLQRASRNPTALPRLFVSCGRQDDLYPLSRAFPEACRALRIRVEYHEEDGKHDWFFWEAGIKRFLAAVLGTLPR